MIPEDKLNKLIESARVAEPELSVSYIENLVKNKRIKEFKFKLLTLKNTIIMGAILSIGLILLYYFNFFNNPTNFGREVKQEKELTGNFQNKHSDTVQMMQPILSVKKEIPISFEKITHEMKAFYKNEPMKTIETRLMPAVAENTDSLFAYRNINIAAIKLIELTEKELLNLGISVQDKKIIIPIGKDRSKKTVLTKEGATFEFKINFSQTGLDSILKNIPVSKRTKAPVSNSPATFGKNFYSSSSITLIDLGDTSNKVDEGKRIPFYPLITDDLGQKWRMYEVEDGLTEEDKKYMRDNNLSPLNWEKAVKGRLEGERKLIQKIPSLVPILVRSGDSNFVGEQSFYRADIIVWFEPTEELFAALPQRISADLKKEYQDVFLNQKPSNKSCNYFEFCKNIYKEIENVNVFPNPSDADIKLEFRLKSEQKLDAALYTINGAFIKKISDKRNFESGLNTLSTTLTDMLPGVYLLVMQTESGETISHRIVRR
ncbi:MAG: T9SS type A sorting domain-containing protein [Bacteroidia bacterium]|nr:T9SS type A sorting domain-containing protein [Bacteroidia bacterium]